VFTVTQSGERYYAWFARNNTLFRSSTESSLLIDAIDACLTNGGEVYFRRGTYNSLNQWKITRRNTTFTAEKGTVVDFQTVVPMNLNDSRSGVLIAADDVTVQGFKIENCNTAGIKAAGVNNITIRNNQIFNTWTAIALKSVSNAFVDSNYVTLTQGDGIYVTGDPKTNKSSNNVTIINNRVCFVGDTAIDVSAGITNTTFRFINIEHNSVEGYNAVSRSPTPSGAAVTIDVPVDYFSVKRNNVSNVKLGLYVNGSNGTLSGNLILNFSGESGIWAYQGNFINSNVTLEHNGMYSSSALWAISTNKSWVIRNNRLTVSDRNGDLAVCARNAVKENNTAYS
jgi:hypothetical protein